MKDVRVEELSIEEIEALEAIELPAHETLTGGYDDRCFGLIPFLLKLLLGCFC
jgi:hypothetical protein